MASAHVYVRLQVTGTNPQIDAVAGAVSALHDAVDAAGGEWCGSAHVERDLETPEPPAVPKALSKKSKA